MVAQDSRKLGRRVGMAEPVRRSRGFAVAWLFFVLPELGSGRWQPAGLTEGHDPGVALLPLHQLRWSPSPSKLGED
jgi:hypothetical protein